MKNMLLMVASLVICLSVMANGQAKPTTQPAVPTTQKVAGPPISFGIQCINFTKVKDELVKDHAPNLPSINFGTSVIKVADGSGMEKAGILVGDVITKIDKKTIKDTTVLKAWTEDVVVGQEYTIFVTRLDEDTSKWIIKKLTFTAVAKTEEQLAADDNADPSTQPVVDDRTGTGPDHVGPRGGVYHYSANGNKVYNSHGGGHSGGGHR